MDTALRVPRVLAGDIEPAVHLLSHYVHDKLSNGGPAFTGSRFESFASARDPNNLGAEDLLALAMLGVNVPGAATLRILENDAADISGLLAAIPTDVDLADAGEETIGRDSPAWVLWRLLDGYYNVGDTLTSKLMARKRPRLIPIQDSVVKAAVDLGHNGDLWSGLRELLTVDGRALETKLRQIRSAAGMAGRFSDLRVFDIVVWMDNHGHRG
jgi:hypothetical protein